MRAVVGRAMRGRVGDSSENSRHGKAAEPRRENPRLVLYKKIELGYGLPRNLFGMIPRLMASVRRIDGIEKDLQSG